MAPSGGVAGPPVVEWVGPQWWVSGPRGGGVLWPPVVGVNLGAAGIRVP